MKIAAPVVDTDAIEARYAALESALGERDSTISQLQAQLHNTQAQLDWFKQQLFGQKSERRPDISPDQLALFNQWAATETPSAAPSIEVPAHTRRTTQRNGDEVNGQGLRFDEGVPVVDVELSCEELKGADAEQYEIIAWKESSRLAAEPGTTVVMRYRRPVVKRKDSGELHTVPAPIGPLGHAQADVSFLAQMVVDKFSYHCPLYRQHQKLEAEGVTLARSALTQWAHQSIALLTPIAQAVMAGILAGSHIKIDETPIKAGCGKKKRDGRGTMKQGWFWPVLGEDGSIAFHFSPSRGQQVVLDLIGESFSGTLQSDGYAVYARYAAAHDTITHALCWSHTRRQFLRAEQSDPEDIAHILTLIKALYAVEAELRHGKADTEKIMQTRTTRSQAIVEAIFEWIQAQRQRPELLPKSPLANALNYAAEREAGLRVFIKDPIVDLDTNDLERALRVIPMGKKNWLFCQGEVGAEHVATIQTLLASCRAHGINPYDYLVDVLQRIDVHPAKDVAQLTPARWKEMFAAQRMVSPLAAAKG